MNSTSRWILASSFAIAAAGFLLPFWPLSVVGVVLAAGSGRYVVAIVIGLLIDIAYGAPIGHWRFLYIPFTLLAISVSFVQYYLSSYIRHKGPDTL